MKRLFSTLTLAVLLFTGCSKSDMQQQSATGGSDALESVTFTAQLPDQAQTKGTFTPKTDGNADYVNRCIMEIYYGDKLFGRYTKTMTEKKATFDPVKMPANRTYNVLFWADYVTAGLETDNYYKTADGLKAVSMQGTYIGNDDKRDAFCYGGDYTVPQGGQTFIATLKRPFAQINVITTDADYFKEAPDAKPEKVNVTLFKPYTTINVKTGDLSGNTDDITYETPVYEFPEDDQYDASIPKVKLSMDYLFSNYYGSSEEKDVINITWKATKPNNADIVHEFTNIPYKRNFRTNIIGDLLTASGNWTVTVDPAWTDEIEILHYTVKTPNDAQTIINNNKNSTKGIEVEITDEITGDQELYIPDNTLTPGWSFPINKIAGGAKLTVKDQTPGDGNKNYKGTAGVKLPKGAKADQVEFNTQNAHGFVSGDFGTITSATSATTLEVQAGSTVENIIVKQGNVALYGNVDHISRSAENQSLVTVNVFDGADWTAWKTEKVSEGIKPIVNIGTYKFDPTGFNVEGTKVTENATYPVTWTVCEVVDDEWKNYAAEEFSNIDITGKTITIMNAAELALLAKECETYKGYYVILNNDIDLEAHFWNPINAFHRPLTINGQNHTIKNLKVVGNSSMSHIGFISSATDLTVKNLNFDGVNLEYPSSVGENARGGVLVGDVWGINADNCSVKNVTIKACQKVGALIGMMEGDTNVPNTVTNCSADNVTISSNDPSKILQHGSGGFIGHVTLKQNPVTTISSCSVSNITINNYNTNPYTESELQRVPHVFVGSICQIYEGAETPTISSHSIVLSNNTISGTNTNLPTCIYSSKYFGWAGNAEERPAWKGGVFVDGIQWAPDYSFECGGVKYYTLEQAIAAVEEDGTVNIIKAGTYDVQTLTSSKHITVTATVDGVVFNRPEAGGWISKGAGVTVKNLTWNIGNANFQYFDANLENCTVNGLFCTHTSGQTFKDCKFVNNDGYNLWVYGSSATFDNCEFTCPGGNDGATPSGSALNLYNSGKCADATVIIKDCKFTANAPSNKYAAIYIKPETAFIVEITNCTVNDNFYDGGISGSKLWNVKDNSNLTTTVTVDGKLVYSNGKVFVPISTAEELQALAEEVNAGKTFSGKTITLEGDIDLSGISNWTPIGNVSHNFEGTFDGKGHTISNLTINNNDGGGNAATGLFGWISSATVKDVNFTDANVTGHHDVGVVAGYMQSVSTCTISGCTVSGATINCTHLNGDADGDKCGGIVGYAGNEGSYVTNCTVSNTTISSGRDAGQVVGAGKPAQVTDCTATNVTVSANDTSTGANIRNEVIGREL